MSGESARKEVRKHLQESEREMAQGKFVELDISLLRSRVGDEMEDGTIFAGISPDTHRPIYATPQDAPGTYSFNQAAKYATNLDAHGHHDWRVPSIDELNVLFENRNQGKLAGTFNVTGSYPAGWYRSSAPYYDDNTWAQRFSDGNQLSISGRYGGSSLRCVR
jgi:hypothetical protein